ncbi:BlaI/MecI/CopY family transcriptional regulator [bacterium]|nr:BlaI/MecI/CopY family transcriptional regulator [bacterium]
MLLDSLEKLSRRERQIMEILYQKKQTTASDLQETLPDAPSNSSIRTFLRILEEKGLVRHQYDGPRFIYSPVIKPEIAKKGALKHLMTTLFDNSAEHMVAALLDITSSNMSNEEYDRLSRLIEDARKEGR